MLYVNEELVNTRNRKPDYDHADVVVDYHTKIRELREYYGKYLILETKVRPRSDEKTGVPRFPGPRGLLLRSIVTIPSKNGDSDTIDLMYSPAVLKKDKEGSLVLDGPNILVHKGSMTIDIEKNPDLAYYVVASGKVGKTPAEGKKFHIYDSVVIDDDNANKRKMEGMVLNLIYSSIPEEKLRTLAKSFGVADVNIKAINSVREGLFHRLQDGEASKKNNPESKARGFKEFVESAEVKYHDQITALCRDAEDAGKLVYDESERRWVIDYQDGGQPYILKELMGEEVGDPLGSVVSFLTSTPNMIRKVESVMGIGKPDEEVVSRVIPKHELTAEMIVTEHNVPKLKKWLKELDPEVNLKQTTKGEEVKRLLLARIGEAQEART